MLEADRQLSLSVSLAYFSYVRAKADLGIAEYTEIFLEEIIDIVVARVAQGEESDIELLLLQLQQLQAQDHVRNVRLMLEEARIDLFLQIGYSDPITSVITTDSLALIPLIDGDGVMVASLEDVLLKSEEPVARAMSMRPDIQAHTHAVAEAEANVAVQRGLLFPASSIMYAQRFPENHTSSDYGLSISLPFLWGSNVGGVREAQARQQQTLAHRLQKEFIIRSEIQEAIAAVNTHAGRLRALLSEHARPLTELGSISYWNYERGEYTLSDVLQIHETHRTVLQITTDVLFDYRINLVKLAIALGIPPA